MGYIQGWWGSWPMSSKIPFSIALKSCSTCEEGSSPMTRNKQMVDQGLRKEEGTKGFLTQTICMGIVWSRFSSLPWSSTYNVRRWFGTPGTDLLMANRIWLTSMTPMKRWLPQQVRRSQWVSLDFKKVYHREFSWTYCWNINLWIDYKAGWTTESKKCEQQYEVQLLAASLKGPSRANTNTIINSLDIRNECPSGLQMISNWWEQLRATGGHSCC